MRAGTRIVLAVAGLAAVAAGNASAAAPGQIGVHVGVARTPHSQMFGVRRLGSDLSFSYQLTERLSLRPSLSLGHSKTGGWAWQLGGTGLYHFRPRKRLSPYLGAGLRYRTRDAFGTARPELLWSELGLPPFPADESSRHYLQLSLIGGTEYSISRRLSLFAEVEGTYRTGRHYGFDGRDWRLGSGGFDVRPVGGLTLKLR